MIATPSPAISSKGTTFSSRLLPGLRLSDLLLLLAVILFSAHGAAAGLGMKGGASEDGAMLLRYSQHLAAHQGITWNVGQPPVEGATDFLYMVAVAAVVRLRGLDAALACRELLFACWILLAATTFLATRITLRASRWLAFALALYVSSAAESFFLITFFGAPFLMLIVAWTWWVGIAIIAGRLRPTWPVSLLFSLLALAIGLTRPEGNVMAVLLLATVVYLQGWRQTRTLVLTFAIVFAVLGGSYFLWRWHYFGHLLPNPFYVKGGGHLHFAGLVGAVMNYLKMLWPAIPVALLALRNPTRIRFLSALLIPVVGYTLIWVLLSPENNHLMRFQMPLLPVVALFLPFLLQDVFAELHLPLAALSAPGRAGLRAALFFYALAACAVFHKCFAVSAPSSGMAFGQHLSQYADRGYTMAVTEAGQFPYFSHWNAIDVLGLNDAWIAHHGLDAAYLDRTPPELILYHYYNSGTYTGGVMARDSIEITRRDLHAMRVLYNYAVDHRYILAAAYGGEPCSLNVFWVRPDTPDTDALVQYLRSTPYYFLDNGILSTDFRNGVRPECHLPSLAGNPDQSSHAN